MEELYTSELTINVSGVQHIGDPFGFIFDYEARIDSRPLEIKINSGQTGTIQIVVYDSAQAGLLESDESLNVNYFPEKGVMSATQPYDLSFTTVNEISNKYRYVMLDNERSTWDSFEDPDISATITGEFSFNTNHSFYSQDGFPKFTQIPKIDIYGGVVRISRQVWAF